MLATAGKNKKIPGSPDEPRGVGIHPYHQLLSGNALGGHNEADLGGGLT